MQFSLNDFFLFLKPFSCNLVRPKVAGESELFNLGNFKVNARNLQKRCFSKYSTQVIWASMRRFSAICRFLGPKYCVFHWWIQICTKKTFAHDNIYDLAKSLSVILVFVESKWFTNTCACRFMCIILFAASVSLHGFPIVVCCGTAGMSAMAVNQHKNKTNQKTNK